MFKDLLFRPMNDEEIRSWYTADFSEAFAEKERKPLADIFSLIKDGRYELWGLFDDNLMLGYAALWKHTDIPLVLLDYLGVTAAKRNSGLGGEILRRLTALKIPLITESELPIEGDSAEENQLRLRRIAFYERNGFSPAYEMATCGMRWQALTVNIASFLITDIMRWHRALYGPERTDVRVPLGRDEIPEMPYWMK